MLVCWKWQFYATEVLNAYLYFIDGFLSEIFYNEGRPLM